MTSINQRSSSRQVRHRGFTLIELLTVIAIIGILAAILIPVVGAVRIKAASTKSASNLRQFANALNQYLAENNDHMPHNATWHMDFLPYLGIEPGPGNTIPKPAEDLFFHPRDISPPRDECRRSYAMNHTNYGGMFPPLNNITFSRIHTPSQLMVFTERPNQTWPAHSQNGGGIALPQNQVDWQRDLNGDAVYNYAFADGHVETKRYNDPHMIGERRRPENPRGMWRPEWLADLD